jgi:hypothetical protein
MSPAQQIKDCKAATPKANRPKRLDTVVIGATVMHSYRHGLHAFP